MFKLLRPFFKGIHILQAKIDPFQNVWPKFFLRFLELPQFNENQGIFIRKLLMSGRLAQPVGRKDIRIAIIHIQIKVQNIDNIHRTEVIAHGSGIHLIPYLECRIIYRPFRIIQLFASLELDYYSCAVISLAVHIIDRALLPSTHGLHLLVNEFDIYNLLVGDDMIEKLDHHILCRLLPKSQFKDIVNQQVCITGSYFIPVLPGKVSLPFKKIHLHKSKING